MSSTSISRSVRCPPDGEHPGQRAEDPVEDVDVVDLRAQHPAAEGAAGRVADPVVLVGVVVGQVLALVGLDGEDRAEVAGDHHLAAAPPARARSGTGARPRRPVPGRRRRRRRRRARPTNRPPASRRGRGIPPPRPRRPGGGGGTSGWPRRRGRRRPGRRRGGGSRGCRRRRRSATARRPCSDTATRSVSPRASRAPMCRRPIDPVPTTAIRTPSSVPSREFSFAVRRAPGRKSA